MVRRLNEKNYTFTDEIMANPTWQKINNITNEFGYEFDPYARVEVYNNGSEVLEGINIYPIDEELPELDITTNGFKLQFEIDVNQGMTALSVDEYDEYVKKLSTVSEMIKKLNNTDFSTLYRHYLDE